MSAPGGRTLPAFDVYAELGLGRDATADQVQSAYRRRAKEHHPDVASDAPAAEARMKRINQARDILLDPARRADYDRLRASTGAPGARPAARRPAASTARSGTADPASAQAERDRLARAEQERRARVKAEQERWEREAEARAARDVAARAARRRGERVTASRAEERPEPGTKARARPRPSRAKAAGAAPQRRGARADARKPAGPTPRGWTDLRAWLGGRVTVEIRVLGDDGILRWSASRGKDRA